MNGAGYSPAWCCSPSDITRMLGFGMCVSSSISALIGLSENYHSGLFWTKSLLCCQSPPAFTIAPCTCSSVYIFRHPFTNPSTTFYLSKGLESATFSSKTPLTNNIISYNVSIRVRQDANRIYLSFLIFLFNKIPQGYK